MDWSLPGCALPHLDFPLSMERYVIDVCCLLHNRTCLVPTDLLDAPRLTLHKVIIVLVLAKFLSHSGGLYCCRENFPDLFIFAKDLFNYLESLLVVRANQSISLYIALT
jgi:hypothetical protein